MSKVVAAWEIKTNDHIVLDRRHYFALNKSLTPMRNGSEIGFCVYCAEQGRRERTWKVFRWNERITRIN